MGLGFSLIMCGFYWLIESAGKGSPPSDSWPVNFLVWFLIGTVGKFVAWLAGGYFGRREDRLEGKK